jgi:hypothetical protein
MMTPPRELAQCKTRYYDVQGTPGYHMQKLRARFAGLNPFTTKKFAPPTKRRAGHSLVAAGPGSGGPWQ